MAANKIQVGYIEAQDGAQFEVDAGTAAAPGLCFDDSAATGLYSPGTGQLAFSTSGKQTALRILADGKVGVDCSPTVALEVNGTIKASAIDAPIEGTLDDWIVHAGDTNTKIGFSANDTFQVHTGGTARVQVTDSATDITNDLIITDKIVHSGDTNTAIRFPSNDNFTVELSGDEKFRLDGGQAKFKVGTNKTVKFYAPTHNDESDLGAGIGFSRVSDGAELLSGIFGHSNTGLGIAARDHVTILTGGTSNVSDTEERLRINSAGDILLGTDHATIGMNTADGSDNRSFSLCGGSDASQSRGSIITFYGNEANDGHSRYGSVYLRSGNTTTGNIQLWTQGNERLRITADGDFGTNAVTPTTQSGRVFHLHAGNAQQRFHMTNNTTGVSATDGFEIIVEQSANTRIRNFEAGDMAFDTGGANNEVMRITSQGNLNIGEPTGLSNMTSFRHINLGNNLIINAGRTGGGYTGFQNNAYLNTSGNWVRIRDDHTSAFGMDDGVFYFRHAGAGTGNISWKYPLTIEASGRILTKTDQSTTGLVIQNTTHDSILRIEAQAANKNSTIHFADGSDGDVGKIDYDHNNNQLSFTVNTASRMWFDDSNGVYISGANHSNLEVRSNDASTKGTMQTVQGSEIRLGATSNHPLAIYAGGLQACKIKTTGFMGVGIDDPTQARFVVKQDSGNTAALIKANTGASLALGGVTQPRILIEAGASASDFILYRATGSSWGSAGWYKTLTIESNGSFRTHKADSNLRPYPIIGGPDIGSSDAEYGQFNYADVMAPNGDLGSWVYLGADYHGAAPWPVKCYKIAKHEPGNNGTRVYQIWHDGDSNHHYGGLWEVRLNSWGGADSNNYFTSASISCINGMRDDISLLVYKSTDGVWIRPSTIWGGLWIRRAGWDGSGRDRGSSYCAVKNGGALASADINGMGGTIPGSIDKRLYPYVDSYSPSNFYGGRDIEDGNDFVAG